MTIDIPTFDVIQITYDEPNADALWSANIAKIPRLRRISSVKHGNRALRAAARLSDARHLVTIDGDNLVTQPDWFIRPFKMPETLSDCVVVFPATNIVNGLSYENGGIKIWPRAVLLRPENPEFLVLDPMTGGFHANGQDAGIEAAQRPRFHFAREVLSQTHINAAPFQAFRSGYRAGYRLTLDPTGRQVADHANGPLARKARQAANTQHIGPSQQERLRIWCSVGADTANGIWVMLGARLGALAGLGLTPHQTQIDDYDWFDCLWQDRYADWQPADSRLEDALARAGGDLAHATGYEIATLDVNASRFAKSIYRNRQTHGLVVDTEMR